MKNYVITIARGYGSGGKEIGMRLAEKLGIECYEHRILSLASEYSGYGEDILEAFDEKISGSILTGKLGRIAAEYGLRPMKKGFISDQKVFDVQKKIIENLAKSESCIIIGKCADYILKEQKNVISIYIEAPRPYCRDRIMKKQQVSEEEADMLISSTDKYRAEYYRYYTNGNYWTNPINYDLTLNSERITEEKCIELIIDYVHMKMEGSCDV